MQSLHHVFISEVRGCFIAETESICINTNMPEIAGTPVEFYDDTLEGVLAQVIAQLKGRGFSGRLRVHHCS